MDENDATESRAPSFGFNMSYSMRGKLNEKAELSFAMTGNRVLRLEVRGDIMWLEEKNFAAKRSKVTILISIGWCHSALITSMPSVRARMKAEERTLPTWSGVILTGIAYGII